MFTFPRSLKVTDEFKTKHQNISSDETVGRLEGKARTALAAELEHLGHKTLILTKPKELRETNHELSRKVNVCPDLTRNQRNEGQRGASDSHGQNKNM